MRFLLPLPFLIGFLLAQTPAVESAKAREIENQVDQLVRERRWSEALSSLSRETKKHTKDWRINYLHGVVLNQTGHQEEALDKFASLTGAEHAIPGLPKTKKAIRSSRSLFLWGPEINALITERDSCSSGSFPFDLENAHPLENWSGIDGPKFTLPDSPEIARRSALVRRMLILAHAPAGDAREARVDQFLRDSPPTTRWFYLANFDLKRFRESADAAPLQGVIHYPLALQNGIIPPSLAGQHANKLYKRLNDSEKKLALPYLMHLPITGTGNEEQLRTRKFRLNEMLRLQSPPNDFEIYLRYARLVFQEQDADRTISFLNLGTVILIEQATLMSTRDQPYTKGSQVRWRKRPAFPPSGPIQLLIGGTTSEMKLSSPQASILPKSLLKGLTPLRDRVHQINHRVLRAAILQALDEDELVVSLIREFEKSDQFHERRAAAAFHGIEGNLKKSFELFQSLGTLEKSAQRESDQYLIFIGDCLAQKPEIKFDLAPYFEAQKREVLRATKAGTVKLLPPSSPVHPRRRYRNHLENRSVIGKLSQLKTGKDFFQYAALYYRVCFQIKNHDHFEIARIQRRLKTEGSLDPFLKVLSQTGQSPEERIYLTILAEKLSSKPASPLNQFLESTVTSDRKNPTSFGWLEWSNPAFPIYKILASRGIIRKSNPFSRTNQALCVIRYFKDFPTKRFTNYHKDFRMLMGAPEDSPPFETNADPLLSQLIYYELGMSNQLEPMLKKSIWTLRKMLELDFDVTANFLSEFPEKSIPPEILNEIRTATKELE